MVPRSRAPRQRFVTHLVTPQAPSGRITRRRNDLNVLSDVIRRYRSEHGITPKEFATLIGLSARQVLNLERGLCLPKLSTLRAIARLLDWSYEELGQVFLEMPDEPTYYSDNRPSRSVDSETQGRGFAEL